MIDLLIAGIITASHHGGGHSHHAHSAGCQINLYSGAITCDGKLHGPDWDTDPGSYIEGCSYDSEADSGGLWIYSDGTLCRGTGEDPTVDSTGLPACADHRLAVPQGNGRVTCVLPSSARSSHDSDDQDDEYDSEEVHSHGHGGHRGHHLPHGQDGALNHHV